MGMVVSAAVTGIPIIEELERPYFVYKNATRAIVEPPLAENKPHIPPPSVEAARRTYSTKKIAKNDKNSNLKGKIPTNSKKLARKKLK